MIYFGRVDKTSVSALGSRWFQSSAVRFVVSLSMSALLQSTQLTTEYLMGTSSVGCLFSALSAPETLALKNQRIFYFTATSLSINICA